MYKVKNEILPPSIQKLFKTRDSQCNLRRMLLFEKPKIRTNHCVSVRGVNVWNSCPENVKLRSTLVGFKKLYKNNVISRYSMEI